LVKGSPRVLVRDGEIKRDELRRCRITAADLDENLRLNGNVSAPGKIREARLERNGKALITISYPERAVQVPRGCAQLRRNAQQ